MIAVERDRGAYIVNANVSRATRATRTKVGPVGAHPPEIVEGCTTRTLAGSVLDGRTHSTRSEARTVLVGVGTLESLFPGRIDLGLGRAPGTDPATAHALRRTQVAAALGLPFASHFAPAYIMQALQIYRSTFRPSPQCARPYAILGVSVVAADTDEEARLLATSGRESFANLRRGRPTTLPPPNRAFEQDVVPFGAVPLEDVTSIAMVGSPCTVLDGFRRFVALTTANELMVVSHAHLRPRRPHPLARDRGSDRRRVGVVRNGQLPCPRS